LSWNSAPAEHDRRHRRHDRRNDARRTSLLPCHPAFTDVYAPDGLPTRKLRPAASVAGGRPNYWLGPKASFQGCCCLGASGTVVRKNRTDIAGYRSGGARLHYRLIGVIWRFADKSAKWMRKRCGVDRYLLLPSVYPSGIMVPNDVRPTHTGTAARFLRRVCLVLPQRATGDHVRARVANGWTPAHRQSG
jgi:hypothetical protein